jgi:uncharacterized protein (TIGR02271 family)
MISTDQARTLLTGGTVVEQDGSKIGKVGQIYLDDQTGEPEWVTVSTGLFGSSESFIPLAQAEVAGEEIRVPYAKDKVKGAPRIDADGDLSQDQEAELYSYYGLGYSEAASESGLPADGQRADRSGADGAVGRDVSGPTTDEAMTRSEEQLSVGTTTQESGRARLRKFIVTEAQTVTVPVSHEQARVEREPITEANRGPAMAGGDLTEEEHEVTLHAERAVVDKETVPVERVRLDTETVTSKETVTEDVRKEQIETDGVEQIDARDTRGATTTR